MKGTSAGAVTDQNVIGEEGDPSIAINSLPSIVDPNKYTFNRNQGHVSVNESLTQAEPLPAIRAEVPGVKEVDGTNTGAVDDMSSVGQHSVQFADVVPGEG